MYTPQDYVQKFQNLPQDDLKYLFYSDPLHELVYSYKATFDDAWDLLKPEQENFANQLRFHLGANPDFDPNAPVPSVPAFALIAQAYYATTDEEVPNVDDLGTSPLILTPLKQADSPPLPSPAAPYRQIDKTQAFDFLYRWRQTLVQSQLTNQLLAIIDSYTKRLKAMTFSTTDVVNLKYNLLVNKDIPPPKPPIYINLGSKIKPSNEYDPYEFRLVIQNNIIWDNSQFFEFSQPCPPICDEVVRS